MSNKNNKTLNVVNFVQGDNYKIPDEEQVKTAKAKIDELTNN